MRNAESQVVHEDSRTVNEHANTIPHNDLTRRPTLNNELPHTELTGLPGEAPYALNFSFEELNNIGLEEAPPRHSNLSWQVISLQIRYNLINGLCYNHNYYSHTRVKLLKRVLKRVYVAHQK